ncbi:hypothetical protein S7335_3599 [Synechococcus sp. PCC 7335]|uniref:hypothetical protein n=1 Tax=Synechococcus sp. (strain ATCC 29403 / PCC 7335) TaxID=91464 RepID=UPI00017EDC69|nr:hypothetical protein [Synechococcus sp. PCC 7335]EDX85896.1 hypothetical protein S7335_3599 [Synechococcus sp. PCC 7335]
MLLLTVGSVLSRGPSAQAHGAVVEVNPASVEIKAVFDTGEPMSDAQVLVYSPTDLSTPVASGQTDSEGRFLFSPEPDQAVAESQSGRWEVTVRKAGHGQVTTFELGKGVLQPVGTDPSTGRSPQFATQQWISIAAIIWGFVGTALFFKARADQSRRLRLGANSAESTAEASASHVQSPSVQAPNVQRSDR